MSAGALPVRVRVRVRVGVRVGVRARVRVRVTLASGGRVLHRPAHHQARVAVAARAQVVERDDALVKITCY